MRWMILLGALCSACTLTSSDPALPEVPQVQQLVTVAPCTPRTDWIAYRLSEGETLSELADVLGITVDDIAAANCLSDPDTIAAGQEIVLPRPPYIGDGPGAGPPPGNTGQGCEVGVYGDEARTNWEGGPCLGVSPFVSLESNMITVEAGTTVTVRWIDPPPNVLSAVFRVDGALETDPDLSTAVDTTPADGLSGTLQLPDTPGGGRIMAEATFTDGTITQTIPVPFSWVVP